MTLDMVEIALDHFTDWATFEKLASEVMRDEGYPDIRPMGGVHDRGQDAVVERFFSHQGKRMRVVFQFTLGSDVATKIRQTIKRLDEAAIQYQKLIIVTREEISAETQEAIKKRAMRENQVDVDIYERRTLVNRLGDPSAGIFQRYFPDIGQQVNVLLQPKKGLVEAKQEREREFLKVCYAFALSAAGHRTRKSLLDETVLGLVSIHGPKTVGPDEIIEASKKIFDAGILVDRSQVAASLGRLLKRGLVELDAGRFSISLAGQTRAEAAGISLEATQRSVVSDLVTEVSEVTHERIDDRVHSQLELNARDVLVEYFRMSGLELAQSFLSEQKPTLVYSQGTPRLLDIARRKVPEQVGDLLATAVGGALCRPSAEQARYFAGCSRAYLALQVMNLDPALREFQASRFSNKLFVLDTDIVLGAIIEDLPVSGVYRRLISELVELGAKVVVPDEVIGEVATHMGIAPKTFDYFGPGLSGLSEELAVERIGNLLVLGYWFRGHRQGWTARLDFRQYRENYFEPQNPQGFIADIVRTALPRVEIGNIGSILQVTLPESEVDSASRVLMDIVSGTAKGIERTKEQNRELAGGDAKLMVAVSKCNDLAGRGTGGILVNRAYILTCSGRYLRVAERLRLNPHLSARPHIVIALLEMVEPSPVDDREFVALFENPLLQQTVEACWPSVKVLLDAGVELKNKSITRLRYDVERRLHAEISSLREADAIADSQDDADPTAGDREHLALLDAASGLGYRATTVLEKLRQEGRLKEKEIARLAADNEELREAVNRFGKKKARWLRRFDEQRGRQ